MDIVKTVGKDVWRYFTVVSPMWPSHTQELPPAAPKQIEFETPDVWPKSKGNTALPIAFYCIIFCSMSHFPESRKIQAFLLQLFLFVQASSLYEIKWSFYFFYQFSHAKSPHLHASESSSSQTFIKLLNLYQNWRKHKMLPPAHSRGAVTFSVLSLFLQLIMAFPWICWGF